MQLKTIIILIFGYKNRFFCGKIKTFIDDLNNNKNTTYKENCDAYNEKFEIVVEDTIKIITNNSTTILTMESKNQLINAMNKYYDILNKYPTSYTSTDDIQFNESFDDLSDD